MSYITLPSSGGVQNPMTENLDAGGFDIDDADTINTVTINGANPTGLHLGSNATQKVGFHGATPVVQGSPINVVPPPPAPPVYDGTFIDAQLNALTAEIGAIVQALQDVGLIA
jgi:hypothetical protein